MKYYLLVQKSVDATQIAALLAYSTRPVKYPASCQNIDRESSIAIHIIHRTWLAITPKNRRDYLNYSWWVPPNTYEPLVRPCYQVSHRVEPGHYLYNNSRRLQGDTLYRKDFAGGIIKNWGWNDPPEIAAPQKTQLAMTIPE